MPTLAEKLTSIRGLLDVNTSDVDTDSIAGHAQDLAAMIGLSAECKADARRRMEEARLIALKALIGDKKVTPSILLKMADGAISEEIKVFEYADRLNAGITHKLDLMRSIISLRKTEIENSMRQS